MALGGLLELLLFLSDIILFKILFSNSLIIYQVQTKKITSMEEVWVPGLN